MRVLKGRMLVVVVGFAGRASSSGKDSARVVLAGAHGNQDPEAMQPLSEVVVAAWRNWPLTSLFTGASHAAVRGWSTEWARAGADVVVLILFRQAGLCEEF
jgi:hypothetical protein